MTENPYKSANHTLDNELRASLTKDQAKLVFDWILAENERYIMPVTDSDTKVEVYIKVSEERFKSLFYDPDSPYNDIGRGQFQPVTEIDEDHGGRYMGITEDQALSIFVIMRSLMKEGQFIDDQNQYFIAELFKFAEYDTYWNLFRDTMNEFLKVYDIDEPKFTKDQLPEIIQKIMDYRQPRGMNIIEADPITIAQFRESFSKPLDKLKQLGVDPVFVSADKLTIQDEERVDIVNARCPLCLAVDRTSNKNIDVGFICSECSKRGSTVYMEINTTAWDILAKERRKNEIKNQI